MPLETLDALLSESNASTKQLIAKYQPTLETIQALKDHSAEFYSTAPAEATRVAELAYRLGQSLPSPAPALGAWALANAHVTQGHFSDAIHLYEEARSLYLASGHKLDAARMTGHVAMLAYTGDIERALEIAAESEPVLRKSSLENPADLRVLGNVLMNVGIAYELQGAYEDSLAVYEEQIQIADTLDDQFMLGQLQQNKGCTLIQLNAFDEAHDALTLAEEVFIANEQFLELTLLYPNQALLFSKTKQYAAAKEALSKAEALLPELGDEHEQRHLLTILNGLLFIQMGKPIDENLMHSLQLAQKATEEHGPLELEKLAWITLGNCYLGHKNWDRATASFNHALGLNREEEDALIAFQAWYGLAKLAEFQEKFTESQSYFEKSIEQIEAIREDIETDLYRAGFLTDKLVVYQDLTRLYMENGNIEEAFQVAERSKARVIAERLSATVADPARATLFSTGTIGQIQKYLSAHTLLYYHIVRTQVWVFVISAGGIQKHIYLADVAEIEANQEKFSQSTERMLEISVQFGIERANRNAAALIADANNHLHALYSQLLQPIVNELADNQPLYISTDGPLHAVPFHALYDGNQYLVEERAVSYVPSATVFALCMQPTIDFPSDESHEEASSVLLFGYDSQELAGTHHLDRANVDKFNASTVGEAPARDRTSFESHRSFVVQEGAAALRREAEEYLPAVQSELNWLTNLFADAECYSGDQATANRFLSAAPNCSVLHFAAHAHFRVDKPMLSSFTLADRSLTLAEINLLRLQADLVVLSGCETIHGQMRGADLLSLASGFLSAGARSLLVSLWRVEDTITSQLMSEFYLALAGGASRNEALCLAQCKILASARQSPALTVYAHPAYWAPFTLIGNADSLKLSTNLKS